MQNSPEAVIIGAGFGGIGAAIALNRIGINDLVILEREDDLGGTWHVNHYPGLAVDIPSTTYSYSFEPNPEWSRLFAPGAELKRYAEHVADTYDIRRYMRFGVSVESAEWDEELQRWRVSTADGQTLTPRYLIAATGFLSQPHTPDIPGITEFAGTIVHTTAWDDDLDFTGRKVAIIGTGATAVQLIPELAKSVAELTVFQRTPIWVVPKIDFAIPAPVRRLFGRIPLAQRAVRGVTDVIYEIIMIAGVLHFRQLNPLNRGVAMLANLFRSTSVRDRRTRDALAPDYDFGCKRPTYSNEYYRTFNKPNVSLQAGGIERITADGIDTADGAHVDIDTLVLATGFDLWDANFPAIEIIGREGRSLGKWWRDNRFQAYQGISVPMFPNLFNLAGPYSYSGLSYFTTIECEMIHMQRVLGEAARRGATTVEVSERANDAFLGRMTEKLQDTVFNAGDCATSRSYYFNHAGEATLLRPTSTANAFHDAKTFPLTDYQYTG
ncbi:MAG: NAD(P)/FAD-dependent oxidoreductase [Mycolicibacterium insubricum]